MSEKHPLAGCFYAGRAAAEIRRLNNRLRAREGKPPLPRRCTYDGTVIHTEEHEQRHATSLTHELAVQRRAERLVGRKSAA